jgi:hypothetical protein
MSESTKAEIDFATATADELKAAGYKVKRLPPAGRGQFNAIKRRRDGGGRKKLTRGDDVPVGSMLHRRSRKSKGHEGVLRRPTETEAEKRVA